MLYTIIGDANQCVVAQMTQGDEILAEVGAMVLLSDGVALEAAANNTVMRVADLHVVNTPVPLTHFRCLGASGVVAFAAPYSGEARELTLRGSNWMCARESFLFCSRDVTTNIGFAQSIPTGYFRDSGFVLYRVAGYGEAYIHCGGNVIEYDLSPGQRVSVDAGCVAAFQDTVKFSMEAFDGLPSTQGGSESLFLVTLTGPGRIYLATLPLSRMAEAMKSGRPGVIQQAGDPRVTLGNLVKEL
jgi:uncharacterized protein (AIM24 family)